MKDNDACAFGSIEIEAYIWCPRNIWIAYPGIEDALDTFGAEPEEPPTPSPEDIQNHIGMIYAKNADGTDQIIEAKGEAYGTNIWTRAYRGDSSYGGVRRAGWSG